MNNKIFNYKLLWRIGMSCLCGQVDKRVGTTSRIQVQVNKKKILEKSCRRSLHVDIRGIQGQGYLEGKGG